MEENFDLLAQSRANYYTKGSPVQFVRVELLKGDVSGDVAVCLSFKNITARPLTGLAIRFRCKDRTGAVVCADQFYYQDLDTANGQVFGADDAVYISQSPIGSVEVDLEMAYFADGSTEELAGYSRVRLQPAKKLPADIAKKLCDRTHKDGLTMVPQVTEDGWYCACGAFHPREEEGVWCSECGADRILLQNTLSSLLQQGAAPAPATDQEPTRMAPTARPEEPTRMVPPVQSGYQQPAVSRPQPDMMDDEDDSDMQFAPPRSSARREYRQPVVEEAEYEDEYEYEQPRRSTRREAEDARKDEIAEMIIRWAPPITAVLCAVTVVIGIFLR